MCRRTSSLLLAAIGISLPACDSGTDRTGVIGQVSFEGKLLDAGMVEFNPIDGTSGPSTGAAIQQGRYEIPAPKGPKINGTYEIRITGGRKSGKTFVDRDNPKQPMDLLVNVIPPHYNSQSSLRVTLAAGSSPQVLDFDLHSSPPQNMPRQRKQ